VVSSTRLETKCRKRYPIILPESGTGNPGEVEKKGWGEGPQGKKKRHLLMDVRRSKDVPTRPLGKKLWGKYSRWIPPKPMETSMK